MEGEDEEVDFFVEDFIARGVCTLVVGKAKRSGKTTFVCTALRAMPRGLLFCGKQTRPANVLYVTEQNPLTFRKAIRESGLKDDMDHVQVVFLSDVFHMSYEQTVNKHAAWCKWHGYDLMVLDTFMEVAKLKGSEENESGVIAERMRAARIAGQRENIGMVLVHHAGRSGTSPRGSSAFEGSVDIIGELSRPEGHHEKNDRKIEVYGRVDEWESVVQWIEGERYIRKGGNDLEFSAALEHVRTVMREVLGEEDSLTVKEVTEKNPDVSGGETRKVLQWLADKNPPELFKGKRTGARGRPADTYWRSRPESSFFNPGRVGGESENKIPNPSNPAYLSHTETEEFIPEGVYSETPEINSPASLPPNSSLMNITRIEISEEEYEEEERLSRMPRKNPKRRGV